MDTVMSKDELQTFEDGEVLERMAWFPWVSTPEFEWLEEMTERGIQLSMLPEEGGISVYRVNR